MPSDHLDEYRRKRDFEKSGEPEGKAATRNADLLQLLEQSGAPRREIRKSVRPMLATLEESVPVGPKWLYEMKYDGIRALGIKKDSHVRLYSRSLKPLEAQFPEVMLELERLPSNAFWIDGEIAALDEQGRPRFQLLQPRIHQADPEVIRRLQREVPAY